MTTGQMIGWIGGGLGVLFGVAGGAFGTYCSIKNTRGPRERSFMIRVASLWWLAAILFIGLLLVLPDPYRSLLWIPYAVLLPLGIIHGNRRQQRIRKEEAGEASPSERN